MPAYRLTAMLGSTIWINLSNSLRQGSDPRGRRGSRSPLESGVGRGQDASLGAEHQLGCRSWRTSTSHDSAPQPGRLGLHRSNDLKPRVRTSTGTTPYSGCANERPITAPSAMSGPHRRLVTLLAVAAGQSRSRSGYLSRRDRPRRSTTPRRRRGPGSCASATFATHYVVPLASCAGLASLDSAFGRRDEARRALARRRASARLASLELGSARLSSLWYFQTIGCEADGDRGDRCDFSSLRAARRAARAFSYRE